MSFFSNYVAPVLGGAVFSKPARNLISDVFGGGGKQTNYSEGQIELIDELLNQARQGNQPGAFEDFFTKAVEEPAMSAFNNRIAPQIQQRFVATGMGGTPINDALTRAGADVNAAIAAQRIPALKQFEDQRQFNVQTGLKPQYQGQEEDFLVQLLRGLISGGSKAGSQYFFG